MDLHILAVDDDPEFLLFLKLGLQKVCRLTTAQNMREAFTLLGPDGIDMVLLDIGLGEENGLVALRRIREKNPRLDVVMVSGHKEPRMIVEAISSGAADYLTKPFEIEELIAVIEKTRPLRVMRERHEAYVGAINEPAVTMIGEASSFRAVLQKASLVKGHAASILIEGESGTGKEMLARYIHHLEREPSRPFVAVNCAAIPENLLESELFGHEKGSFTGAHCRKIGKFELASGGDIFLDEVSCLKWDLQAKILRALQEKEFTRVGGNESIRAEFRAIAATNEELEKRVEEGKFRRDLYHRLRVIALRMPPLREREEDIPLLISHFLKKHDTKGTRRFGAGAVSALQNYLWPGNIRELEHLVQSLVILSPDPEIARKDLPDWVFRRRQSADGPAPRDFVLPMGKSDLLSLGEYVGKAEKAYILKALEITRGDKTKTAKLLNISRTRLYERLKTWGVGG